MRARKSGPGVRVVDLSEREAVIPDYKMVKPRDVVIQPGATTPDNMMKNDMLCHMTEGELAVVQNGKELFGAARRVKRQKARRTKVVWSQSCGSSI